MRILTFEPSLSNSYAGFLTRKCVGRKTLQIAARASTLTHELCIGGQMKWPWDGRWWIRARISTQAPSLCLPLSARLIEMHHNSVLVCVRAHATKRRMSAHIHQWRKGLWCRALRASKALRSCVIPWKKGPTPSILTSVCTMKHLLTKLLN